MGLHDEFEEAVTAISKINFAPPSSAVNIFETTIRYLGGLIAAYDLTSCKDGRLLAKAIEVADMIYASFDTPTHMPVAHWNADKAAQGLGPQEASRITVLAELGTFSLEFIRLSQLTGDMRYYDAVVRITNLLDSAQNSTSLPGLWPVKLNLRELDLNSNDVFTLGPMSDSEIGRAHV